MTALVDFEMIEEELRHCFAECSYSNDWLLDDVLVALALYLHGHDQPVDDEKVYDALIRVLIDNNLPDIARVLETRVATAGAVALNRRVAAISQDLNLRENIDIEALFDRVRQQLRHLNYEIVDVREGLIRELILQELAVDLPAVKEAPLLLQSNGLFTPVLPMNNLRELPFSADVVDWDWQEVSLRAGGAIFRSVRVDINTDKIHERLAEDSFVELVFFDALSSLLRKVSFHLMTCLEQLKNEAKSEIAYLSIHCLNMPKILHNCPVSHKNNIYFHLNEHLEDNFLTPFEGLLQNVKIDIHR